MPLTPLRLARTWAPRRAAVTALDLSQLVDVAESAVRPPPTSMAAWTTWNGPTFNILDVDGGPAAFGVASTGGTPAPSAVPVHLLRDWLDAAVAGRRFTAPQPAGWTS